MHLYISIIQVYIHVHSDFTGGSATLAKFGYLLSISPGGKIRFEENRVLEKRFSPERKWGGRADMEPRSAF